MRRPKSVERVVRKHVVTVLESSAMMKKRNILCYMPCVYGLVFVRTSVLVVVVLYSGFLHDFCVCSFSTTCIAILLFQNSACYYFTTQLKYIQYIEYIDGLARLLAHPCWQCSCTTTALRLLLLLLLLLLRWILVKLWWVLLVLLLVLLLMKRWPAVVQLSC